MKKLIVDLLMFILMILEFSRSYMNPLFHEIIGILLFVLLILHLVLNIKYIKSIPNGKYNYNRLIMLFVNILFLVTFALSIILGILSSQDLLKFLNMNNLTINNLHKVFSYISLITLGIHLGINFNIIFGKFKNNIIFKILEVIISLYGLYSFFILDIIKHITGDYGFNFINGNLFVNTIRYLSVSIMIMVIINILHKIGGKNER